MKKTIALAMLLASAVCAQAAVISLTPEQGSFSSTAAATGSNSLSITTNTDYLNSFTLVETNIGNGGSWVWTATFTLNERATLDSLKAGVFTSNGSGKKQEMRAGSYTLSVLGQYRHYVSVHLWGEGCIIYGRFKCL